MMTEEDREFVREQMEEAEKGPLLLYPVHWIVSKVFWMNEFQFFLFNLAIMVGGSVLIACLIPLLVSVH